MFNRVCLIAVVTCVSSVLAQAQYTTFELKGTPMPVADTADQFVEVEFTPSTQTAMPSSEEIVFRVWSLSKRARYADEQARRVTFETDGARWSAGVLSRTTLKGKTENGTDYFYGNDIPTLRLHLPIPVSAKIRKGRTVNGLVLEWMNLKLTPDQLLKVAHATKADFSLDNTSFAFLEDELVRIREEANRVKP